MDAGLRCGRIENELCLSVLLQHRVITGYYNRTVRIPIRGKAQAKYHKIYTEGQQRRGQNEEDDREEDSPEAVS